MLTENATRFANPATGKLELEAILDGLLIDGHIEESNSQLLRQVAATNHSSTTQGPLERIAASNWMHARDKDQKIDLDFLSRWLAEKVDIPWHRVDPLKVDVPEITSVAPH